MFVEAFELLDLEGQDGQQNDHHQQEGIDPPLHQRLHLWLHTCNGRRGETGDKTTSVHV